MKIYYKKKKNMVIVKYRLSILLYELNKLFN